jgi:prepilin-type N-terminal cleavage/methylation domain-containing protein
MIRTNKGFTLVELMVVIVIIGILAALAIPKFTTASDKAKWSEVPTVLAAYENAQTARVAETSQLGDSAELVFDKPANSKWFNYAFTTTKGEYQGTVATGAIGKIVATHGVKTAVDSLSAITHSCTAPADSVDIKKMIGNFLN